MNYLKTPKLLALMLVLSLTITSCGDDPVSGNEEPPEFPQFNQIEPELSYFENNNAPSDTSHFFFAKNYAIGMGSVSAIGQIYSGFFTELDKSDAEYKNGTWIWNYSYSYQGESIDITLKAEDDGVRVFWEMLWSYEGEGQSFTDYKVLEGQVAHDGTSGSWTFNSLNPETQEVLPVLVTNWTRAGEEEVEIVTDFYNAEGRKTDTYTFYRNSNEFHVVYESSNQENNITVFWDTEAETGYYELGSDSGERYCWDSNFENVNCADVGY